MIKKFLSILLVTATLTGAVVQVSAAETAASASEAQNNKAESEAKVKKDDAKDIAIKFLKDFCDIDLNDKKYEVRIQNRQIYGVSVNYPLNLLNSWDISFQVSEGNNTQSVNVQVNSDSGKVTGFNSYSYSNTGRELASVPTITEEKAKEIGDAFLEKLYPGILTQIAQNDNDYMKYIYNNINSPQYSFKYYRVVNGIKFDSNSVSVTINSVTGKVSGFSYNWSDELSFPNSEPTIEKDKANELFMKEADLKLSYADDRILQIDPANQKLNVNLVYGTEFKNGNFLDAKTGSFVELNTIDNPIIQKKDLTPSEKEKFLSNCKEVKAFTQELDEKQATAKASEFIEKLLGEDFEVNSTSYDDGSRGYSYITNKSCWQIQFTSKKPSEVIYQPSGVITIDAATGHIITISKFNDFRNITTEEVTPKLSWEEAYNKAINILEEYYPDKLKNVDTQQNYIKGYNFVNNVKLPETNYTFNFTRTENGIPYTGNSINISIDIKTGSVSGLMCNWNNDLKFPGLQGVISKEDAKQQYFKVFIPELAYQLVNKGSDPEKKDYEVKLVYRLKPSSGYMPLTVDAFTGKSMDFTVETVNQLKKFKEEIKGHWGEKEFEVLLTNGLIDINTFKPDTEITRMEAIKILLKSKGYSYYSSTKQDLKFTNVSSNSKDYKYIQTAVMFGLIENTESEFNGDEKITREEMAELFVKLIKYDRLAKSKKIFNLSYSDTGEISPERYGYVAIGTGLELFSGDNGKFMPKSNTTMAEFAITVYKLLNIMKELGN